jgi:hypothetical protein
VISGRRSRDGGMISGIVIAKKPGPVGLCGNFVLHWLTGFFP